MVCPYFKDEYTGICTASGTLHIPGIAEMEQLCFSAFGECPIPETEEVTERCGGPWSHAHTPALMKMV